MGEFQLLAGPLRPRDPRRCLDSMSKVNTRAWPCVRGSGEFMRTLVIVKFDTALLRVGGFCLVFWGCLQQDAEKKGTRRLIREKCRAGRLGGPEG